MKVSNTSFAVGASYRTVLPVMSHPSQPRLSARICRNSLACALAAVTLSTLSAPDMATAQVAAGRAQGASLTPTRGVR